MECPASALAIHGNCEISSVSVILAASFRLLLSQAMERAKPEDKVHRMDSHDRPVLEQFA
jgi:hypothetical protein